MCCTEGGVVVVLAVRYEPLRVSCADTVFRFAFISSITQLTVLLTEGGYIPEQLEGEAQVPVDLLCQQRCKLPAWRPSSIFFRGPSVSLTFAFLCSFSCNPPVSLCHSISLFLSFYLVLCHFGFISQQVFASLRTSLERREH